MKPTIVPFSRHSTKMSLSCANSFEGYSGIAVHNNAEKPCQHGEIYISCLAQNILLVHYKRSNHEFFTGQDMFLQICLSSTFLSPSSCRSLVRKTCRCDSHNLLANIMSILSTQSKVDVSWAAGTWNSRAERCILGVGICLRFSMGTLDSSFHQTFGGFDDLIHGRLSWPVKGSGENWLYT